MEAAYKRGLEEIRAGRYFEAHEELEEAWRVAPTEERDFFQGLVHVAVAWYQAGRGRPVATGRQLEKATRRLGIVISPLGTLSGDQVSLSRRREGDEGYGFFPTIPKS